MTAQQIDCPNRDKGGEHRVKWNSGNPWCLTCDVAAVAVGEQTGPKYPDVEVELVGQDGNAFAILGAVCRALRRAGHGDVVDAYMEAATAGDYDHLLRVTCEWVEVS